MRVGQQQVGITVLSCPILTLEPFNPGLVSIACALNKRKGKHNGKVIYHAAQERRMVCSKETKWPWSAVDSLVWKRPVTTKHPAYAILQRGEHALNNITHAPIVILISLCYSISLVSFY